MILYWMRKTWGNTWNKIFTWFYFLIFLFDLLVLAGIFFTRIFFEVRKAYMWKQVAHLYPDRPRDLLNANKALRSIGKGDHNIAITKGGYTQVAPSQPKPKANAVIPQPNADAAKNPIPDAIPVSPAQGGQKPAIQDVNVADAQPVQ
jgi:hypothetical protein